MRHDKDVRALVDSESLHQIESIVVIALGVGLVELNFDAFVAAGRREHLIERVTGSDEITGAQRPGAIRARPRLDHHVLGQCLRSHGPEQDTGQY